MKWKRLYWIPVILLIGFIFSNSLSDGETSGGLSAALTLRIYPLFEWMHLPLSFSAVHHLIRKLAHFSEFFLLSVFSQLAQHFSPLPLKDNTVLLILMILIPSVDETIQLFVPGRAGMIQDVLLDMSGFALAWLFGMILCYLIQKRS